MAPLNGKLSKLGESTEDGTEAKCSTEIRPAAGQERGVVVVAVRGGGRTLCVDSGDVDECIQSGSGGVAVRSREIREAGHDTAGIRADERRECVVFRLCDNIPEEDGFEDGDEGEVECEADGPAVCGVKIEGACVW